jgi:hypothetical protein
MAHKLMFDPSVRDVERHPLKLIHLRLTNLRNQIAPVKLSRSSRADERLEEMPLARFLGDGDDGSERVSYERTDNTRAMRTIDCSRGSKNVTSDAAIKNLHGRIFLS